MTTLYSAIYKDYYPFHIFADKCETIYHPDQMDDRDSILVLWGGEDISPSLYNERPNRYTYASEVLSNRDEVEVSLAKAAIESGIPIIGICRGAQLMCALSGGKLVQHVTNHSSQHYIATKDGHNIKASSLHHQMMFPFDVKHEMIATSLKPLSSQYLGEDEQKLAIEVEPEIVYFPETKCLAIQGHPEYMDMSTKFVEYCNQLVVDYLK